MKTSNKLGVTSNKAPATRGTVTRYLLPVTGGAAGGET